MTDLALPTQDRRIIVRSFWFILSLALGSGLWLLGYFLQVPYSLPIALIAAALCEALVFAKTAFVHRLYHAWNRRLVRPVARMAARGVMGICYLIIFSSTGRVGSLLREHPATGTKWNPRCSVSEDAYADLFAGKGKSVPRAGWIRNYFRWAIQSGNAWSICLIPFLWFLRLLSGEEEKALETNIYTLF